MNRTFATCWWSTSGERGCEVTAAAEGREAIGLIQRTPGRYTLVVTDLQLPGLDGLAVLRAARAANPSVYVVIITGYAYLEFLEVKPKPKTAAPVQLGGVGVEVQTGRAPERRQPFHRRVG